MVFLVVDPNIIIIKLLGGLITMKHYKISSTVFYIKCANRYNSVVRYLDCNATLKFTLCQFLFFVVGIILGLSLFIALTDLLSAAASKDTKNACKER